MKVVINGIAENTTAATVLDLLRAKDVTPQLVAVEVNERILDREEFGRTPIKDGDAVEFLYFMGGGQGTPTR